MNKTAKFITIFLFLSLELIARAQKDLFSGNTLLEDWKEYKKWYENNSLSNFNVGYFMGYVAGIEQSMSLSNSIDSPAGVTQNQLCMVVGKYLEEHPEELHQYMHTLVRKALLKAFPKKISERRN